ncbi:hypothetical protein TIFTF001_034686 [Ficus carica]|nr:hypothetical protein TIFTF001_034686 [Ficus carica]
MAAKHEHQDELPQGSPVDHQEASTSEAISQITNLTRLVEELTKKHNDQQSHMENITAENQILKNQLMSINSQAAYSYYYNPYFGYSTAANNGGWNPSASQNPQGANTGGWPYTTLQNLRTSGVLTALWLQCSLYSHLGMLRHKTSGKLSRGKQHQDPNPEDGSHLAGVRRPTYHNHQKIQRATTLTPGIDDLARGVREMPLTSCITNTITPKFGSISFPRFDGISDPHDHLLQYKHVVQSTNIATHMLDDMMCKLFAQSLKGATLRWFCNLPPESIDSFDELSLEFMRSYSRFSKAISEISGLDDGTAREALKKANGFIKLEEENERVERDLARTRDELSKARDDRAKTFRREHQRPQCRTEHRVERTTRRDHKRPLSPPKYALGISPSELIAHLKRQDFVTWPKKLPENPARDTTKY